MSAYRLVGKKVVPAQSLAEAYAGNRSLAKTDLPDDVHVSTVFLGLDHSWGGKPPVVFETMIFGGPHDMFQERYSDYDEALVGHERAVKLARGEE